MSLKNLEDSQNQAGNAVGKESNNEHSSEEVLQRPHKLPTFPDDLGRLLWPHVLPHQLPMVRVFLAVPIYAVSHGIGLVIGEFQPVEAVAGLSILPITEHTPDSDVGGHHPVLLPPLQPSFHRPVQLLQRLRWLGVEYLVLVRHGSKLLSLLKHQLFIGQFEQTLVACHLLPVLAGVLTNAGGFLGRHG